MSSLVVIATVYHVTRYFGHRLYIQVTLACFSSSSFAHCVLLFVRNDMFVFSMWCLL